MTRLRKPDHVRIPPLREFIRLNEELTAVCGSLTAAKTVGIALNTASLDDAGAEDTISRMEDETGLPVEDVVRSGAGKLGRALLES
jgi:uncharacterized NAD-dependent epimerase/dehydratase family protein